MTWEQIIEQAAKRLYEAKESIILDEDMVKHMATELMQAIFKGYGKSFDTPGLGMEDEQMLSFMESNVFVFSGFKNHQQLKEASMLLKDSDGKLRSFNDFMADLRKLDETYSVHYAKAEYNHAQNASMMASKWQTIQKEKEALPLLQYNAVKDTHTRPEHAALDGVIRKADDEFWLIWMPPNGWNCRCDVSQLSAGEETNPDTIAVPNVDAMWRGNVGIDGVVFPKKHPYFAVPKAVQPKIEQAALALKPKRKAKGMDALREEAKSIFESNVPVQVKVTLSSEMTEELMKQYNAQLKKLFNEYEVAQGYKSPPGVSTTLMFKSEAGLGYLKVSDSSHLFTANFGHRADKQRAVSYSVGDKFKTKSQVDDKHVPISTCTHEFAHLITTRGQVMKSTDKRVRAFWTEMEKLRTEYHTELRAKIKAGDSEWLKKNHLGTYAEANANEFFAEGFTEYKLNSNPSPWAVKVGKVTDKHFKKK